MTRDRGAFTLVELVVVIAVLSIISLITITYVARMSEVYLSSAAQRDADDESYAAWTRIQREFRLVRSITAGTTNSITFTESGMTNTVALSGQDLTLNGNYLARNVSQFRCGFYDLTNGPLAAPLSAGNLAMVRRIHIDLAVLKSGQSSSLSVNLFYPKPGIVR